MSGGGKRPGAGRKPGSKDRTIEERFMARRNGARHYNKIPLLTDRMAKAVLADAVLSGQTPLEVMLFAMRWHFSAGRVDEAAKVAKDAAPYMHPHLTSTKVEIRRPEDMTDDELAAHLAAAEARAGVGGGVGDDPTSGTGQTRH